MTVVHETVMRAHLGAGCTCSAICPLGNALRFGVQLAGGERQRLVLFGRRGRARRHGARLQRVNRGCHEDEADAEQEVGPVPDIWAERQLPVCESRVRTPRDAYASLASKKNHETKQTQTSASDVAKVLSTLLAYFSVRPTTWGKCKNQHLVRPWQAFARRRQSLGGHAAI